MGWEKIAASFLEQRAEYLLLIFCKTPLPFIFGASWFLVSRFTDGQIKHDNYFELISMIIFRLMTSIVFCIWTIPEAWATSVTLVKNASAKEKVDWLWSMFQHIGGLLVVIMNVWAHLRATLR